MKKRFIYLIIVAFTASLFYDSTAVAQSFTFPTADESDPAKIGWMQGFPPAADKRMKKDDGSFYKFPQLRYTFSHFEHFAPMSTIARGNEVKVSQLKYKLDNKIDEVTFIPLGGTEPMTWKESLAKNYADGILIMHKGKIVYEDYFGVMNDKERHVIMSCTKSLTSVVALTLAEEGKIDLNKLATEYVPEMMGTAFEGATVQQILNMTTSMIFSENYLDPNADIWKYTIASGTFSQPAGYDGPVGYFEYLLTLKKADYPHGERFSYKSVNTDAIAWIVARATGKRIDDLMEEYIWSKLGMEQDALIQLDVLGIPFAGGGLSAGLRDLARIGEMMRNEGKWRGKQIVPKNVIASITEGGSKEAFNYAGYKTLPGWTYKNMWWVSHNENGAFTARGVHGQTIYIDPAAEMVIVRLASNPIPNNPMNDHISLPAYSAVAKYLMEK